MSQPVVPATQGRRPTSGRGTYALAADDPLGAGKVMRHAEAHDPTTAKALPDLPALIGALTEQEVPAADHCYPESPPDSCRGETLAPTLGSDRELCRSDRLVPGCDPHPSMLCGTMGGGRRLATRLAFTDQSD